MIKQELREKISGLIELPPSLQFTVEQPPKHSQSDLATNLPIILSRTTGKEIKKIADEVISKLQSSQLVEKIDFAAPGFINFNISLQRLAQELKTVTAEDNAYPGIDSGKNKKVLLDFVSANPTGPLHIGHARCAIIGDTLSRIFRQFGWETLQEYYVNDIGTQMDILSESVEFRSRQLNGEKIDFPENAYKGEYITEIAGDINSKYENLPQREEIKKITLEKILDIIKNDLTDFGVNFDSWIYESELHNKGIVEKTIDLLKKQGVVYEKDGALWFGSAESGDEKDRVVKRKDGRYTYFGADIAYHSDKIARGFDKLINIWGTDHHGYVPRIMSAIKSLGYDENNVKIILYQLVSLSRNGVRLKMSTRAGEFITLREVMKEIGVDATRYFLSTRTPESHLEFDLELAKKQSPENPVYYVQYAHTRCCGIFREAKLEPSQKIFSGVNVSLLKEPAERCLMKKILFYPDTLNSCINDYTPHHITTYLLDLAGSLHKYYDGYRVLGNDEVLKISRLYLINAVRIVIRNGLSLLGISAPSRM